MSVLQLRLAQVQRDPQAQMRERIDEDIVDQFTECLDDLPPVDVFRDEKGTYWLADGWKRFRAHEKAKRGHIYANVRPGELRDAILWACGVNATHGQRRTRDDARRAVLTLLDDDEWGKESDTWIARHCRVRRELVAAMRSYLSCSRDRMREKPPEPQTRTVHRGTQTYQQRVPERPQATVPPSRAEIEREANREEQRPLCPACAHRMQCPRCDGVA